ncbi:DnaJ homolog subfamily A member 5 [Marchantia polymorpha subsp. ruderalis]|uniref:J domain-containing protein n=2 Tax=Marchantia polymorpha TaxID=3197 RepID=A0AAF6BVB6_MARPO|nr:hypothetical protein MARPO_0088s0065 [Marchantia polymorpha]BBN15950.1 hypothetical protein Mp_7g02220 [Marchantia polymorpha subsp. ruderalis]|eukprot:PTQ33522.1 hypothetical protein MARPO_0088s0065 [Marchantia polymorpha]
MADGGRKECWYAILGVSQTATAEEIRTAYRKEALKWHPDKIQQSGASPQQCQEATARFQSINQANEVLGDPTERAWYDKHRNEILSSGTASKDFEFSVWSFFSPSIFSGFGETGKGFFKVYGDVFKKIHKKEQAFAKAYGMGPIGESPSIGSLHTDYSEVDAFYKFWLGFATVKDFAWCDEYRISDARNRKERRLMEEENAKIRKRERRDFNDAVRQLATFVKKRDRRVLDKQLELQMKQVQKEKELKERRQRLQEEKLAKARAYKEQDWAKLDDGIEEEDINEDEGSYHWKNNIKRKDSKTGDGDKEDPDEFYCIVCSKRFRSEKQWTNHEKSKKHIDRAAALKQSFLEEDEEADSLVKNLETEKGEEQEASRGHSVDTQDFDEVNVHEYGRANGSERDDEYLRSNDVPNEDPSFKASASSLDKEAVDMNKAEDDDDDDDDDEASILAAMMNSHRSRQAAAPAEVESVEDEENDDIVCNPKVESPPIDAAEDSDDIEDEDDEDSILAAMLNSHRSRRAVSPLKFGDTAERTMEDDETQRKVEDSVSSVITHDENLSAPFDDEEKVLESMLESRRCQDSVGIEGKAEPLEETCVSSMGDDIGSEEETMTNMNAGKSKLRRRSKQERQHLAAQERHDDILKELSSSYDSRNAFGDNVGNGNSIHVESETTSHREEPEDLTSSSSVAGKKSKPSQRHKQVKQDVPVKGGASDAKLKIEVQQSESSKKGIRARGKKGKAAPKAPPSNTCDTCGEDFESRNQLFRHITVTNHSSVKSK